MDLCSNATGHGGVDSVEEMMQARHAVIGRQIWPALCQGVHHGEARSTVHETRGKPTRGHSGCRIHGIHQQIMDHASDEAGLAGCEADVACDCSDVPPLKGLQAGSVEGGEDVIVERVDDETEAEVDVSIVALEWWRWHLVQHTVDKCVGDAIGA